ncbi:cation diffusion facilitator family transporter [Williamsia herbipolensis]|uniref:cation diffusion facilitator family transporter n=1 Tax=Williamsia herbipolensis TaxID=1603258 RepID=UPI0005F76B8A|nr:cation diffusion facilitator family transporter [Williamsia herbipolensis]
MSGDHSHHHPHDHDHHGGWRHALSHAFTPHSHDSADKVDGAMESSAQGIRAVKISMALLLATAVVQLAVVVVSGSVALLADTIHNFSDALTSVPLWIAFVLGRRAPTRRYTYGFGRAEDLAGLFVVLMILASAVVAGVEAVRRLIDPAPLSHLPWVAAAGAIGFVGNEIVARYRITIGRRIGSVALIADGKHARTDGFTSLAVLVGAAGAAAGFPIADPIVGLVITAAILMVLVGAARDVFRRLMDGVDPEIVGSAEEVLASVPGVDSVAGLRMRWVGHTLHAEADLDVPPDTALRDAHALAHRAEHALIDGVARLATAQVHAYPGHQVADGTVTRPAERSLRPPTRRQTT